MYVSPATALRARKEHRCTWCGEAISPGSEYLRWMSVDDSMYTNKMHRECFDACHEECTFYGEDAYMPFDNHRPPPAASGNTATARPDDKTQVSQPGTTGEGQK
jgi:hypothetical protein